jgi:hypothetical protein
MNPITTTHSWEEVDKICQEADLDTWVIWDVDNTLLFADDTVFGCYNNTYKTHTNLIERYEQAHSNETNIPKYVKNLFYRIRSHLPFQSVHLHTTQTIQNLQKRSIPTFALTFLFVYTEEKNYIRWRQDQLTSLGIDFSNCFYQQTRLEFPDLKNYAPDITAPSIGYPIYENGVFYTHHQPKGICLTRFMERIQKFPKKIIFIDDAEHYLNQVGYAAKNFNIAFQGIQYLSNKQTAKQDPKLIEKWEYFRSSQIWVNESVTIPRKSQKILISHPTKIEEKMFDKSSNHAV